ncbi:MAG: multiheme c-type cytochrome [Gammaproteobacteria bacterium]
MNPLRLNARAAAVVFACLACCASAADKQLGVASCAGSACHGAARMAGNVVRQDEYLIWQRKDQHARAYATLRTERSRRIAANLGLADATTAPMCLTCHADPVPVEQRGGRFQLSDGVGCETCHGPAERWFTPHTRGYPDHKKRLADGMYPTWDLAARAELCVSCHQGSASRPMTHAIMGAGHPALLFELDTFGALQPAHYDDDADYATRKGQPDGTRSWAVGQVVAARGLVAGLAAMPADSSDQGIFPELAWFNCSACHHAMQPPRWEADPATGLPPGRVRLADVALHQVALWLEVVRPELAARWRGELRALHQSTLDGAGTLRERAAAAGKLLDAEVLPLAVQYQPTQPQLRALALALLDGAAGPRATDFATAEQAAMATAVLVTALQGGGTPPKSVNAAIDAVYAAVADREKYEAGKMRRAAAQARAEIAKTYK